MYFILFLDVFDRMNKARLRGYASTIVLTVWVITCLLLEMAFSCNLKSYLVAVDFEKPIDSIADIVRLGKKLYLPSGNLTKTAYNA